MNFRWGLIIKGLIVALGLGLLVPASSSATVEIQAHRGGPIVNGKARFAENSMEAFENALSKGWTIELDLQRTSDGVAVVMHDEDLDRTTTCSGAVADRTYAQIHAECNLDVIGFEDTSFQLPAGDAIGVIPKLSEVIKLLEKTGGKASIEVKDLAGDHPDFAPNTYKQLEASDVPASRVTVQNFKPSDLDRAHELYPGVTTSYLTISFLNKYAVVGAVSKDSDQVSPEWPISAEFVADARAASLRIAPFTLDTAEDMKAADALGVDAIITNDPTLASRLVGPKPSPSMKILKRKAAARPGKVIRLATRIRNSGKAQTNPGRIKIKFNRSSLKPAGPVSQVVPVIKPGHGYTVVFRVRVRRGAKRFGRFPVTFRLSGTGKPAIKKVKKVRALRA